MHLKLDELLRAVEAARTSMVELEDRSDAKTARTRSSSASARSSASCARTPSAKRSEGGRRVEDRVR